MGERLIFTPKLTFILSMVNKQPNRIYNLLNFIKFVRVHTADFAECCEKLFHNG